MSAKARVGSAAQWLPLLLFTGFVAVSVVDTGATAASKISAMADVSAAETIPTAKPAQLERTAQAIASLATTPPASNMGLASIAVSPANTKGRIQLASVDPATTPEASNHARGQEPFGLPSVVAPESVVWSKWRKVMDDVQRQQPTLMRCLADETACSPATARFAAIVKEARERDGRVRLNFVNQRVNNAIRYTSDMTQWGTPDEWSAPLAAGKGSFETGIGDCEDYAIAKYAALRAAGVSADQLRVLLVRDNTAGLEHAVLAANVDSHWYVLDNRWTAAVEDADVRRFTPLFALDDQGVRQMAVSYAVRTEPKDDSTSQLGGKKPSSESVDRLQSAEDSIRAFGLRPSII